MKLSVKNFRSFTSKDLELPDSGIIHLRGDSEKGKTTILESIAWGLFGTDSTRNVSPLGTSKKTVVSLSFRDIDLVRMKGPNSFECNGVQDEVAQGVVNSYVASCDHFKLSSYVQQKMKNCFLSLTPKNQLDFLERLAIDSNIDEIKKRIKSKIDHLKIESSSVVDKMEYAQEQLESTKESLLSLPHVDEVENPSESIEDMKWKIEDLRKKISHSQNCINSLFVEKTDQKRSEHIEQIRNEQSSKYLLEKEIVKNKEEISRLVTEFGLPDHMEPIDNPSEQIEQNTIRLSYLNQQIFESQRLMSNLVDEKNDPKRDCSRQVEQLSISKQIKTEEYQKREKDIEDLQNWINSQVNLDQWEDRVNEAKERIILYRDYFASKKSLEDEGLCADIEKREKYIQAISSLKVSILELHNKKALLAQNREIAKQTQECPHCKHPVRVFNGQVVKTDSNNSSDAISEHDIDIEIAGLNERLLKIEKLLKHVEDFSFFENNPQYNWEDDNKLVLEYEEFLVKVQSSYSTLESLKQANLTLLNDINKISNEIGSLNSSSNITVRPIADIEGDISDELKKKELAQKELEQVSLNLKELEGAKIKFQQYSRYLEVLRLKKVEQELQQNVLRLEEDIKNLETLFKKNFRDVDTIDKDIASEEKVKEDFTQELNSLIVVLVVKEKDLELYRQYLSHKDRVDFLKTQIKESEESITKLDNSLRNIKTEIEKYYKLEKIVQKAQLSALEMLTESINTSVQIYLDRFFPDSGTVIRILPYKVNKDGSVSDKIGLEIVHNGVEYKTVDDFSGGAENRAILAFQLAISDLVASPILMLDEPLVGVHESLRNEIYEHIRDVASEKLVLVVEHGAPENLFDLVVDV